MNLLSPVAFAFALLLLPLPMARAQLPEALAAPGETVVATIHAEGAAEKRTEYGKALVDGKTVGRHYAGPSWELADGNAVVGKVSARAPGATPKDIPLLKLEAISHRGAGQLSGVTTIQRLNTKGGVAEGSCESAGAFLSVPYSADYAYLKKGG